jgi:hypothetical protein
VIPLILSALLIVAAGGFLLFNRAGDTAALPVAGGAPSPGGLAASTLITLVFVPTVHTLFEEGPARVGRRAAEPALDQRPSAAPGQ